MNELTIGRPAEPCCENYMLHCKCAPLSIAPGGGCIPPVGGGIPVMFDDNHTSNSNISV